MRGGPERLMDTPQLEARRLLMPAQLLGVPHVFILFGRDSRSDQNTDTTMVALTG
jgi:hypothetical protein